MAVKLPDIIEHNNPVNAAMDTNFVRGGGRVVADVTALYALSSNLDQLKERVTEVYVTSLGYKMQLNDIANAGNSAGWGFAVAPVVSDAVPTSGSTNLVQSGGTYDAIQAAKSYADALLVSVYKDCGNWDASGGAFPTTGGTGASGAIKKGNSFEVNVAGTMGGQAYDVGDTFRALVDAPGQTLTNWATSEHNLQQATETTRGTAKIADQTTIQTETSTDDQAVVTTKKFWLGIARLTAIAQTIAGNWNFTGTLKQNSNTVETQNNKDASGGYAGLTLFKINFKNALNTVTSFFANSNTAARTYTFQDRNGTMADDTDLATKYDKAGGDLNAEAYIGLPPSTATPATPSTGIKLYFKSGLTWLGTNGFSRTFSGSGLTASRTFTLPDADGSLALNNYSLFFQNPCTQFQDYFKNAAAIKTINLKSNVATYQYSTNGGTSWTTPSLPLSSSISIAADTIITHKITYNTGYVTAIVYIELS